MAASIIVQPDGGLANRMRVLDSAFGLARETGWRVEIHWNEAGMQCPYARLFGRPDCVESLRDLYRKTRWSRWRRNALAWRRRLTGVRPVPQETAIALWDDLDGWCRLLADGPVHIMSHDRFFPTQPYYRDLTLTSEVEARVAAVTSGWSRPMAGVHIRRTDNIFSVAESPTEKFHEALAAELRTEPETGFFLATDDDDEEAAITARFGDQVSIHRKSSRDRGDPEAIVEALVDFVCLARTRKIIGSYGSSFSREAAKFGGIPLVLASDKDEP